MNRVLLIAALVGAGIATAALWRKRAVDAPLRAIADTKTSDQAPERYVSPSQERVIVRAARLRLSTDKKQGLDSPPWVKKIATRPL